MKKRVLSFFATMVIATLSLLPGWVHAAPPLIQPIAVTASSTSGANGPGNATDGNLNNYWSATDRPTQWIQLDLGKPTSVGKIRLMVNQSPAGNTKHEVWVGSSPANLRKVKDLEGYTTDAQWLEVKREDLSDALGNIRYVKINTTVSPSWVGWREIQVYGAVEYMGYFHSSAEGETTASMAADTIAAGANLAWIRSSSIADIDTRLSAVAAAGGKAVVALDPQLFQIVPNPMRLRSRNTRLANLDQVASVVAKYPGVLAALYLLDEPYFNGANWGVAAYQDPDYPAETCSGTNSQITKCFMEKAATDVRTKFPSMPIAVILSVAPVEFDLDSTYVSMFDWVGFDCYGPWSSCHGQTMASRISTLRAKLTPAQRMIAVPWSYRATSDTSPSAEAVQMDRVDNISQWHKEVIADSKYVAVIPFLWQSLPSEGGIVGSNALPWPKERNYQLSRHLLHSEDVQVYPLAVSASQSYNTALPFAATDRNDGNYWSAGGYAPQWISFDFGGSTRIAQAKLRLSQSPSGPTWHVLQGAAAYGADGTCATATYIDRGSIGTPNATTQDNQVVQWNGSEDVTCVRVVANATGATGLSPLSWVGWREISFFRQTTP